MNDAVERAITLVDMQYAADRKVGGYSKGMRQRIKVAGALVHDPDVILMDEPLNGTDPVQRAQLIRLIRELGDMPERPSSFHRTCWSRSSASPRTSS